MPAPYSESVRGVAFHRYVVMGETPEQVSAAMNGEPVARTIREWAAADNWDGLRVVRRTSKLSVGIRIRTMIDNMLAKAEEADSLPEPSQGDAVYKWLKAADMLDGGLERASIELDVLGDLNAWIAEREPALAERLAPLLGVYAQERVQEAT